VEDRVYVPAASATSILILILTLTLIQQPHARTLFPFVSHKQIKICGRSGKANPWNIKRRTANLDSRNQATRTTGKKVKQSAANNATEHLDFQGILQ
jgi:hypothetical protein